MQLGRFETVWMKAKNTAIHPQPYTYSLKKFDNLDGYKLTQAEVDLTSFK